MKVFVRVFTLLAVAALLSCQNPANAPLKPSVQSPASSWVVSTFAGSERGGYRDGPGTSIDPSIGAWFDHPYDVAVDASDNVYVADTLGNRIRKITPEGVVSTLAGDGTAGYRNGAGDQARFDHPAGVAVDSSGNVYVADTGNHRIRKITSRGVVSAYSGSGTAGLSNGSFSIFERGGRYNRWVRSWYGRSVQFNRPSGIAVDSTRNNVYVADTYNHQIRKIAAGFDAYGRRITYETVSTIGADGVEAALYYPHDVALDRLGNLYVADSNKHRILKFKTSGEISVFAGSARGKSGLGVDGAGTRARFDTPSGVAVDASGNVFVADTFNNLIRMITPGGVVSTIAGSTRSYARGHVDGTGDQARFNNPYGVAVDSSGNVYVADAFNHRIRKITRRP